MPALSDKGRSMADGGLLWGATNSGKSYSTAHHALLHYTLHPANHLLTGSNIKLLQGEIIPMLRSLARHYGIPCGRYSAGYGRMNIGLSTLTVIAGKNAGDEDRLRTYHNIGSLWAEEVTAQPEVFYDMAVSRCDPDAPKWATCNPSHPTNWVKRRLDAKRWPNDAMFLVSDNPSLTDAEREAFEAQFVGTFRRRMIEALWAAPEGLVYPAWDNVAQPYSGGPCYIGVDYGESNITTAIYAQLVEGRHVVTREYWWNGYEQGRRNPTEHAQAIKDGAPGPILGGWIDPSARDLRLALRKAGVRVQNAHNDRDGYEITDGMLQRGMLQLVAAACPNLNLEILSLVYNRYGDAPDPACSDHATDALRYLACGLWEGKGVQTNG